MIDTIKYDIQSRHDDFIILWDKFECCFCIHSKDEDNDVGVIKGFPTAADAINFALNRVKAIDKPSTQKFEA